MRRTMQILGLTSTFLGLLSLGDFTLLSERIPGPGLRVDVVNQFE